MVYSLLKTHIPSAGIKRTDSKNRVKVYCGVWAGEAHIVPKIENATCYICKKLHAKNLLEQRQGSIFHNYGTDDSA